MSTLVVQHPTLPAVFNRISSDDWDAWKAQGWKRSKKADLPKDFGIVHDVTEVVTASSEQ